jgi:hypothetical protein
MTNLDHARTRPRPSNYPKRSSGGVDRTLRNCLAREMDVDTVAGDDATFLRTCQSALDGTIRDERYFHFSRGFLPLFERLHEASARPRRRGGDVVYRVTFS